jgi:hypothetical protein
MKDVHFTIETVMGLPGNRRFFNETLYLTHFSHANYA